MWPSSPSRRAVNRTAVISSTSNPRVQRARKLKRRSDRNDAGSFLIESPLTLGAALEAGLEITDAFVSVDAADIDAWCRSIGLEISLVTDNVLRSLADTATPQGVVAVASIPGSGPDAIPADADLVLVLAEVRDPGNAGTLVRSATAAGADAVVFTEASVDPYAPKTVRSSAGALFSTTVVRNATLASTVGHLRERGLAVFMAEASDGTPLFEADLTVPLAIVVGNEAHGIPTSDVGGHLISIPMPGGTESLNVAVAGSILLYETVRQRAQAAG
jgi:TrmH family RNA methyltransferase